MNAPPFEIVGAGILAIGFILIFIVLLGAIIGYGIQLLVRKLFGE